MALIESRDALEGGNVAVRLPGVQKGDMASRNFKPEVNVYSVRFSPTAQSWAAATTEGLLIYSLDRGIVFDPLNLSLEVTPKKARECLQEQEYSTALLMALKLNETKLIEEIIEQIPYNDSKYFLIEFSINKFNFDTLFSAHLVASSLPDIYAERLLEFVGKQINSSQHVEFYVNWSTTLLTIHAPKENALKQQSLVAIQDSLVRKYDALNKICDFNKYTLKVLMEMAQAKDEAAANGSNSSQGDSDEDDGSDFGENLVLIRQDPYETNGNNDTDEEMPTEDDDNNDSD